MKRNYKLLLAIVAVAVVGVSAYYLSDASAPGRVVFQKSYDFPAATFPNGNLCTTCYAQQQFDFPNGTTISIHVAGTTGVIIVSFFGAGASYEPIYINGQSASAGAFGTGGAWTVHITNSDGQVLEIGNGSTSYSGSHADVTIRML